jgi:predicted DNA-binding protein (MmcQ/YjbR family)/protein-tyrosine-phosphatase
MTKTILFLCTGNYYRSRFSEIMFNRFAVERGLDWEATSRGLAIHLLWEDAGPFSPQATAYLTELGWFDPALPAVTRYPVQASLADLEAADRIIAIKEEEHRPLMDELFPNWQDKIEYWHIHDLDQATYHEAMPLLKAKVAALMNQMAGRNDIDLKKLREYCLRKPGTEETRPFGPDTIVFKVMGKMYALCGDESQTTSINLKCDPDDALVFRAQFPAVQPGYHMNKKHWNTVQLDGTLPDAFVYEMIDDSYDLVVKTLRKADREKLTS